ncbi:MAG: hypothetical protein ACLTSX_14665 [Collinsella sp.]
MFLTEDAIDGTYNTCFKVNPPAAHRCRRRGAHRTASSTARSTRSPPTTPRTPTGRSPVSSSSPRSA